MYSRFYIFLYLWTTLCFFDNTPPFTQTGYASYYGGKFENRKTASGERFHKDSLTAAHCTLPFGTKVKVTNLKNNKSVVIRINDRKPKHAKRIIDVSYAAAVLLDMQRDGIVKVKLELYEPSTDLLKMGTDSNIDIRPEEPESNLPPVEFKE